MHKTTFVTYLIIILSLLIVGRTTGQISCDSAKVICELVDFDGFTGVLPDTLYSDDQPKNVCDGNGVVDNPYWISFVATNTDLTIVIYPTNCEYADGQIGLQATLFDDCSFESYVDCNHVGVSDISGPDSIVLSSTSFVPGHVYKLLLDGRGGSVCDFKIKVKEGNGPPTSTFQPILSAINYDNDACKPISICEHAVVPFTVSPVNYDSSYWMTYLWTIAPFTDQFPTGSFVSEYETTVDFQFTTPGNYTIKCIAYNACDSTGLSTISLKVDSCDIWNEYFQDTIVCQEDFPVIGPSKEDPNGDGVSGWKGNRAITGTDTTYYLLHEGLDSVEIVLDCGSSYWQYINVVQIDLAKRTEVITYFCYGDPGPYLFNGVPITGDVEQELTLQAASGCDSLIVNKAVFIDVAGELVVEGCTDSLQLGVQNLSFKPSAYHNLFFNWYDMSGGFVVDLNSWDNTLKIVNSGSYSLGITVEVDGASCEIIIDTIAVDFTNLVPAIPVVSPYNSSLCDGAGMVTYMIESPNSTYTYTWSWPSDVVMVNGQNTDKITLDWTGSNGGSVTVFAMNMCGVGEMVSLPITFEALPIPQMSAVDTVCIESVLVVDYTGDMISGYNYFWEFNGGANGNNAVNEGPYDISWTVPGLKSITLYLASGDCVSDTVTKMVYVVDKMEGPVLSCNSVGGQIVISWMDKVAFSSVIVNSLEGKSGVINGDKYIIDGLTVGETVKVEVYALTTGTCSETKKTIIECKYEACDPISFDWEISSMTYCASESVSQPIKVNIIGDGSGVGVLSGTGVVDGNSFNPSIATLGKNVLHYNYTLDDCTYMDSIEIMVHALPSGFIEEIDPDCYDDLSGTIIVHGSSAAVVSALNGEAYTKDSIYTTIGNYSILLKDGSGCVNVLSGHMDLLQKPILDIVGPLTAVIGDDIPLSFTSDISTDRIDSIVWLKKGILFCKDCTDVVSIQESSEESYCVQIFFDGGCFIEDCLTIKENISTGVYFPTIFTPASSDKNSSFIINIGRQAATLEFLFVYDHWGNQLYAIENKEVSGHLILWDGHYRGEMVMPGVYVYAYKIKFDDGRVRSNVGDVTVIR